MLEGHQRTTLYITTELHARLRRHAFELNTSMSKLVELYSWEGIARDLLEHDAAKSEGPGTTSPAAGPSAPTKLGSLHVNAR